ncbi:MAG: hypothetical protein ISS48_03145 [Candidatus Aenigmarchaeota archaeon]|nr:hypothetical protein [Candidatus Aenigmarchaeota archaeon]
MIKITKTTRIFSIDTHLSKWLDSKSNGNTYPNIILREIFDIEHDKGSSFVRNIKYNLRKLEEKNKSLNENIKILKETIEKLKK